jgi:hypothetical protein
MQLHSRFSEHAGAWSPWGRANLDCGGRNHIIVKKPLLVTPQTRNVFSHHVLLSSAADMGSSGLSKPGECWKCILELFIADVYTTRFSSGLNVQVSCIFGASTSQADGYFDYPAYVQMK